MAGLALKAPAIRHKTGTDSALNKVEGFETLVKTGNDGLKVLAVMVEGAHCAGCIRKIESRLKTEPGIHTARLNFTTRRLSLVWEGAPDRANDFVAAVQALGYVVYPYESFSSAQKNDVEEEKFLLLCLGVAGFAAGNIMLLSVGLWTTTQQTMGVETRDLMHILSAFIALPTILFSGRPFFRSAVRALSSGTTNMDVPVSVALVLTSAMSLFEVINHGEHAYFDSVVMLTFFLLIGRYLDLRARRQVRSAAADLLGAVSGFATVVDENGVSRQIAVGALMPGMVLRVAAGDKIPADGVVLNGTSAIDMALVTGETLPQDICAGSPVYAGTINLSAPFRLRVMKAGEDTLLSDIIRLMEKAQQNQARYVRLADRAVRLYTPVVHILAVATFIGWLAAGMAWQPALLIAATVLIITCPCALALAVPVVQVLASGRLMKAGILVKSGDALERLSAIDAILLDKTGTLTIGRPVPENADTLSSDLFLLAASLASYSAHPLSRALSRACNGVLLPLEGVREYAGDGMEGYYEGRRLRLGRRDWCGDTNAPNSGRTELWFDADGAAPRLLYFSDRLREDGRNTLDALRQSGLEIILVSGDRDEPVADMATQAGINNFYAAMTPVQKFNLLEVLKSSGKRVLMVGDGLNDAPALAGADVSMSPATASGLAQNAADIVFMGEELSPILTAYKTAIFSQKLVKQNFAMAVLYNIIAIPLAMAGFVTPLVAALAMSGSSLAVIANSFRLVRWRA